MALEKLNQVVNGTAKADDINAFCKVADIVLDTLKVEINYLKIASKEKSIKFLTPNKFQALENKG